MTAAKEREEYLTKLWMDAVDKLAEVREERDALVRELARVTRPPSDDPAERLAMAERMREMAKSFDFFAPGSIGSDLRAWADAIDPPPSIVTGEMIGDVVAQVRQDGYHPDPGDIEVHLDAADEYVGEVERTNDRLTAENDKLRKEAFAQGERIAQQSDIIAQNNGAFGRREAKLTERLAMAEGLLRRLDFGLPYVLPDGGPRFWSVGESTVKVTPDEAEYLRSLDGEGES